MALTGQAGTQAPQSMHSSGWMYSIEVLAKSGSSLRGWMQSTGHTSTHAVSFVLMHGSVMMKAIWRSLHETGWWLEVGSSREMAPASATNHEPPPANQLPRELNQRVRHAGHEKPRRLARHLVAAAGNLEPHHLRIPRSAAENLRRLAPETRIVEARGIRHV